MDCGPSFGSGIWHRKRVRFSPPAAPKKGTPGFQKPATLAYENRPLSYHGTARHSATCAQSFEIPARQQSRLSLATPTLHKMSTAEPYLNCKCRLQRPITFVEVGICKDPTQLCSCSRHRNSAVTASFPKKTGPHSGPISGPIFVRLIIKNYFASFALSMLGLIVLTMCWVALLFIVSKKVRVRIQF